MCVSARVRTLEREREGERERKLKESKIVLNNMEFQRNPPFIEGQEGMSNRGTHSFKGG